jgi:hypothetical protein
MSLPHATYKAGDWTWHVLKVNAPKKSPKSPYATWMVAAQSPHTFGGWDMGDTYAIEVLRYGSLDQCTPEFAEYCREHGLMVLAIHIKEAA